MNKVELPYTTNTIGVDEAESNADQTVITRTIYRDKDTAGVFTSALILGMLIGMAILYVINMFCPVVKQVTNEEAVFKEGVQQGAMMTIYVANRGMTNIPIDQVVSEAWKIRQGKK